MNTPYAIDTLIARLRAKWAELGLSAKAFAVELNRQKRPTIHFNTLAKLSGNDVGWSPSRDTLRDLEDVLILNPLDTSAVKAKRKRKANGPPVVSPRDSMTAPHTSA